MGRGKPETKSSDDSIFISEGISFFMHFLQALEKRTKESKQEMDILEKLEELRDLNTRLANGMLCRHYNV